MIIVEDHEIFMDYLSDLWKIIWIVKVFWHGNCAWTDDQLFCIMISFSPKHTVLLLATCEDFFNGLYNCQNKVWIDVSPNLPLPSSLSAKLFNTCRDEKNIQSYCIASKPDSLETYIHTWESDNCQKEMDIGHCLLQATNVRYTLSRVAILASTHQQPLWNFHAPLRLLVTFELAAVTLTRGLARQKVSRSWSFFAATFFPPGKCHWAQEGWQQSLGCWQQWKQTSFECCCPLAVCPASPSAFRGKDSTGVQAWTWIVSGNS